MVGRKELTDETLFKNKIRKAIYVLLKRKPRYVNQIKKILNKNKENLKLKRRITRQVVNYHLQTLKEHGFIKIHAKIPFGVPKKSKMITHYTYYTTTDKELK